jgi:hypothetical protein
MPEDKNREVHMLRLITDFNAELTDGCVWTLSIERGDDGRLVDFNDMAKVLKVVTSDKVILDPDEDFELLGTLEFRYISELQRECWVARPDWSTKRNNTRIAVQKSQK